MFTGKRREREERERGERERRERGEDSFFYVGAFNTFKDGSLMIACNITTNILFIYVVFTHTWIVTPWLRAIRTGRTTNLRRWIGTPS